MEKGQNLCIENIGIMGAGHYRDELAETAKEMVFHTQVTRTTVEYQIV